MVGPKGYREEGRRASPDRCVLETKRIVQMVDTVREQVTERGENAFGTELFEAPFVRKRDGRLAAFDAEKIVAAVRAAGEATGEFSEEEARRLTARVLSEANGLSATGVPSVEDIQDRVEHVLLNSEHKKSAKAFIIYRDQHARIREFVEKADIDLIDSYLEKLDWRVNENSNMAYSLQGLNNYISSEVTKIYWLNKIYSPELRDAHNEGDLHVHDLGLLSVYCVGWDLADLLREGFKGAPGKAESRPARHFRAALGQVVNFFYTLQGEAAGAQAFSSFDTYLAPFIRYDSLNYEEVKQALQEFVFNVNVPTRVGFQTPFTNVTLDVKVPGTLADEPVIIGGEPQDVTYRDFQEELNIFNRAFLDVLVEGDAKGRVFTFPIPTYNIARDFDWDDPALDRLWEVTARYGIPYFANYVNSDLSPEDARSMCCRLRLDLRALEKRGGGLFGANPLTGSVGVVTINMPRIAHLAVSEADFLARLDELMDLAKASLEIKRKVLEGFTEKSLYPYTSYYLRMVKERYGCYWYNHFSTIGLLGMNEACMNLFSVDIGSEEGRAFAARVMDHMRERLAEYQQETGNFYNLEATPAEGAGYRLSKADEERFPDLVRYGESGGCGCEVPTYTNSTQLPVNYTDDIFEVFDLQDDLQSRYTGGTVLHVFSGEAVSDPQAVKNFVRNVTSNYSLPYFTLSPTFSICPVHGYLRGEQPECPECGVETEVYSRVVGYLRPVKQWNKGKREEFHRRSRFDISASTEEV